MKHFVLAALVALALNSPAHAQKNSVAVAYSKHVPPAARQRVPAGGKSWFYGTCRLTQQQPAVAVHFYTTATSTLRRNAAGEEVHHFVVDLFQPGSKRNSPPRLLNSIRFDCTRRIFKRVSADILWVDSRQRRIPVLRLHLRDEEAHGWYTLVNFAGTLQGRATVQDFEYFGNDRESRFVSFDKTDERGYLTLTLQNREAEFVSENVLRWSGDRFGSPQDPTLERK